MSLNAVRIKAESLQPIQQSTPPHLLRSADCYIQCGIKIPQGAINVASSAIFHSYAELLHACLLEAEPAVSTYVPQPFRFRIGKRLYTPDCYVVRSGVAFVYELKPRGEFAPDLATALTEYLAFHAMHFQVLANEVFYAREVEALNCLRILQLLVTAKAISTLEQEREIYAQFLISESIPLSQFANPNGHDFDIVNEIALFRLFFAGRIKADLTSQPLSYNTVFTL